MVYRSLHSNYNNEPNTKHQNYTKKQTTATAAAAQQTAFKRY
jgi:hypothetical protein